MSGQSISILIADNKASNIKAIRKTLAGNCDFKYKIYATDSGVETLDRVSKKRFDVVLINHALTDIDGTEMLNALSENELNVPVIMIIPSGEETLGLNAMNTGAYDYLTLDEVYTVSLSRAIHRVMHRKRLENDIKESIVKLEKMAIRDGLTGLYNHHHFRDVLKNEYKKAARYVHSLSCIMLDLDHFKAVNDTYGHQFGDFVLAESAKIIMKLARDTDFVARYGGEEFIVLLPNTGQQGAFILAERIRKAFTKKIIKKGGASESVTVSIGLSSCSDDNVLSHEDLIANADKALYQAKWRGRNNVCLFEEVGKEEKAGIKEELQKVAEFYNRFEKVNENIKEECIESAHGILRSIDNGLNNINNHALRVSRYTENLTRELKVPENDIAVIKRAAMLHDIGMAGINSKILRKKGKLSGKEYDAIKRHSNIGVKMIEKTRLFEQELPIILHHHERFDGTGYPHKLKGEAIPFGSRVLAVAEAFDAMTSDKLYGSAYTTDDAVVELRKCSGTQFDPEVVSTFVKALAKQQ